MSDTFSVGTRYINYSFQTDDTFRGNCRMLDAVSESQVVPHELPRPRFAKPSSVQRKPLACSTLLRLRGHFRRIFHDRM